MNLTLFDLDGTLLPNDSDHQFGEFLIRLGWTDGADYQRRNDQFFADYQVGRLDIHAYVDFATSAWRDRPASELAAASARFTEEMRRASVRPAAVVLVQRHREAGDRMAIVTATNDFITRPIAELFGVPVLIATDLERGAEGRATGRIRGVPSFREGKIERVDQWLGAEGLRLSDFTRSTFYSDSTNDLPLLEAVSHPVATNPSPALERIARERGWAILNLFK